MARPTKQGIDYFPLDCQFDPDMDLFVSECGMSGLGILISIWQFIYQNDGYFCHHDDKKFPLHIRRKTMADTEEINRVVNAALELGIFSMSKFKTQKILTSRGIQTRYFGAAQKKKTVYYDRNYICKGVSVSENSVDVDGNATKEKEEEKEKVKELFDEFWNKYPNKKSKKNAEKKYWSVYHLHSEIMQGLDNHLRSEEWSKDNGRYIPHPTTWINGEKWNDEVTKKKVVPIQGRWGAL